MTVETFTCEACGGTFAKDRTDEEAHAEALAIWGALSEDDRATVCEDCWQIIRPDRVPSSADILKLWERARRAWEAHSGGRLPDPRP